MNILAIGSKITIRKICEEIIGKAETINLVDFTNKNYLNWDLSMSNKVKYNTGDIEKIDTLMKAGLEDSDIVIVHSSTDIETLFIAQKSKIDTDKFIFMVLEDLSLADVFESLGFIILDSHNLKITKLLNKLGS
ncbi:MAG: NAD-binding protein [Dehalococcoidia bacterium]|tara:strand:- start:3681 stop:4082 length:402 start_codon:yes stop_codon:yes gene_type:complete